MLRYTESAKTIVAFFDAAQIRADDQVIAAGNELLELVRLAESHSKRLVLSFHGVTFLASGMFGPIILARKMAKDLRVAYELTDVAPHIVDMFRAVRLHKVFRFGRLDFAEPLRASAHPVSLPQKEKGPPCQECGEPLATEQAKQCFACGADWHEGIGGQRT